MTSKHSRKKRTRLTKSISVGGKVFKKRHPHIGARPGTLVIGEQAVAPRIRLMSFAIKSKKPARDETISNLRELKNSVKPGEITWVDVQGFGDEEALQAMAEIFSIHPLALEDIVNSPQRPKAEIYTDQVLVITRMASVDENQEVQMEQVAVLMGKDYVLTFQERYGDILDPVRERMHDSNSRLRKNDADYLMYALVDTIVDGYYPVIDLLGDHLEELENVVMANPSSEALMELNQTKNLLVNMRRVIWPQREAINSMVREDNALIGEDVRVFLRDTYDHCVQTAEVIEMYREMATGLINIYLSSVANRSNEVMKVLTIMASIFIPLTFMAGIYGMNFEYIPELKFRWGYPLLWIAMLTVAGGMVCYFWRKGWIFGHRR